jgi:hypothetical protein
VTVATNQTSATFTYTNLATSGSATVSATFNGNTANATVTVSTGANHLVINEVDYDNVGTDNTEFIEIFNPSGAAISLSGIQLILFNGADNTSYDTVDLTPAGSLPSLGYLVVAGAGVTVLAPAIKLDPGWSTNEIQNGAPDGIVLFNSNTNTVVDALAYEGAMSVDLPGNPQFPLVEGATATAALDSNANNVSVCRLPDGQDTDNAMADWAVCAAPSAGLANQ